MCVCLLVTKMVRKSTFVPIMRDDIYVSVWGSVDINRCNIYSTNFQENESVLCKNVITYWRAHLYKLAAGIVTCDVESSWNVMAHGDAREGKWKGNWRLEWVASTLHTTSEHGVSSTTTADAYTSTASSRMNWGPAHLNGLVRFA